MEVNVSDPNDSYLEDSIDGNQEDSFDESDIDNFIESELDQYEVGPEDFEVLTVYDYSDDSSGSANADWKLYNDTAAENAAEETNVSIEYAQAVGHNARNDMAAEGWLDSNRGIKDYVAYDPNLHGPHETN